MALEIHDINGEPANQKIRDDAVEDVGIELKTFSVSSPHRERNTARTIEGAVVRRLDPQDTNKTPVPPAGVLRLHAEEDTS